MRLRYLVCLCVLLLVLVALVNLAQDDWARCMELIPPGLSPAVVLPRSWSDLFVLLLPVLPLGLLTIGRGKPDRPAWIALPVALAASLFLMLPPSAMHDCDAKGSTAPFAVIFLLPLTFFLMIVIMLLRKPAKKRPEGNG